MACNRTWPMASSPAKQYSPQVDARPDLETLLRDIENLQEVFSGWSEEQQQVVSAFTHAQDALQSEAFRRLLEGLTQIPEAATRLRELAGDEVIYSVLRHHGLIRPSLNERIERALNQVRPLLHGHGGDVEIVSITPPDRVAVRLTGACDGCPASAVTLASGVEAAIRQGCPEIRHIETRGGTGQSIMPDKTVSPFAGGAD